MVLGPFQVELFGTFCYRVSICQGEVLIDYFPGSKEVGSRGELVKS